ncbi:hypothetical protein [Methylobacterium sp. W2]|uniref:hypothetical protein n=1 Tax=Methylobacterium sp. W2 TaxID=2598107 RepID=UPI001D0C2C12|nr:hypothetical protein [Methylobacterium sp. W2]
MAFSVPARPVPRAILVLLGRRVIRARQALPVRRETRAMLDHKATQVLRAQRVLLAPRVPPGEQARRDRLELQGLRVTLALRDSREPRD